MATTAIDKDFVTIKVSKRIGATGIKRVNDYVRFLEINKDAPKKAPEKKITELAEELTVVAWKKFKKQHNLQVQ